MDAKASENFRRERWYDFSENETDGRTECGYECHVYRRQTAAIYGAENVYDFGIGNPNVKSACICQCNRH